MTPIFDAHLDLAYNALGYDRDLLAPLAQIHAREQAVNQGPDAGQWGTATLCLPEMRRAGVRVCVATLLQRVKAERTLSTPLLRTDIDAATSLQAWALAQGQLAWYQAMERAGHLRLITTAEQLREHWERAVDPQTDPIGVILSMEGCDPILDPSEAEAWHRCGVRTVCLAHYGQGRYAMGTGGDGPLTDQGRMLVKALDRLGIILDLVHTADQALGEALALYRGPVMVSHANCRTLVDGDRQLSDWQIRQVVDRGGVIGVVLYDAMLLAAPRTRPVTLDDLIDHIDHLCQLVGGSRHVAIGSDLDGGFGREHVPQELASIGDLPQLAERLAQRGYGESDIHGILHGNWLRFFLKNLPSTS